ncbi:MAG: hypothetical protein PGN37_05940 [Mycobacterium kyogaense]
MTVNSDIDLLLVRASPDGLGVDDDDWDQRLTELARLVTAWTGNDAWVVEYTETDLAIAAAGDEPLLRYIARHGLTVKGTRSWFTAQLRAPTARPS